MKRFGIVSFAFCLGAMLVGCATETRENLVIDTIKRLDLAATQVDNITAAVTKATDAVEKGEKKSLDLTEAGKAADTLKDTGTKIVEIKQRIDMVRSSITDDEKKTYAENQKGQMAKAYKTLLDRQTALRSALAAAEKHDKVKVDELRKRITDAESPFEAQAR